MKTLIAIIISITWDQAAYFYTFVVPKVIRAQDKIGGNILPKLFLQRNFCLRNPLQCRNSFTQPPLGTNQWLDEERPFPLMADWLNEIIHKNRICRAPAIARHFWCDGRPCLQHTLCMCHILHSLSIRADYVIQQHQLLWFIPQFKGINVCRQKKFSQPVIQSKHCKFSPGAYEGWFLDKLCAYSERSRVNQKFFFCGCLLDSKA